MTKRRSPQKADIRQRVFGTRYPGVKGKVVLWAEHAFEEGSLYIRVRFKDETELCWTLRTAHVIRQADLSDWKTGDCKHLRIYVQGDVERSMHPKHRNRL